jgi:predicted Holliday junction resolvase-like endonuclease
MNNKEFMLWPVPPFGGDFGRQEVNSENQDSTQNSGDNNSDGRSNAGSQSGNQPGSEGSQVSDGVDEDDDEDDEFEGLSAKELRNKLRELNKSKKSTDTQLAELQAKVEEAERKERTENENLKKDNEKHKQELEAKNKLIEKQAVMQGILTYQDITFHDPKDIFKFIDLSVITITDDGEAEGLVKQLKDLAKDKPYLVKSKREKKDDDGNNSHRGSTGTQPGQGAKGKTDANAKQKAELVNLYPALAGR